MNDADLRAALRRREPSEGFEKRVMARIEIEREASIGNRARALFGHPAIRWALACAACLVLLISFVQHRHERRVRAEAESARAQATFALRVASTQFRLALQQAEEITQQTITSSQKSKTG